MKIRPLKKITHTLTLDEVKLNLHQFVLAVVRVLEEELPIDIHESILDLFPDLYDDNLDLIDRFETFVPNKSFKLTEPEAYTLYIAYLLMDRVMKSSYKEKSMGSLYEEDGPYTDETRENISEALRKMVPVFFEETDDYAARTKTLRRLPEIMRKFQKLPAFD